MESSDAAEQQRSFWGRIDPADHDAWLRQLDYYAALHELGDQNLGLVLDALDASGRHDDTAVFFTSDHGDMCGSHGLRSKGPFVYEEIMRIPLYARVPAVTAAGAQTRALASHADLAKTIASVIYVGIAVLVYRIDRPAFEAPARSFIGEPPVPAG